MSAAAADARRKGSARIRYQKGETREKLILEAARCVFLEKGWDGFGVDAIAEYMESSRTLVYAHFPSKEEILLALAIESKRKRLRLSEATLKFQGRARERMIAIDMMESYLTERDLPVELLVTSTRQRARTSPERQEELKALELQTQKVGADIVREAVATGDLVLPRHISADQLYFSLWSAVWGAMLVKRSDFPHAQTGVSNPTTTMRLALLVMLDGMGWKPVSGQWDYHATYKRVATEIFETESFRALMEGA